MSTNLCALKTMDYEPSVHFVTYLPELKLDPGTMFEWQKYSQESTTVSHFNALLESVNLQAQASETVKKQRVEATPLKRSFLPHPITSLAATIDNTCIVCKAGKHPLYSCSKFKSLPPDRMLSTLKSNGLCLNCKPGHFVKECTSLNQCCNC